MGVSHRLRTAAGEFLVAGAELSADGRRDPERVSSTVSGAASRPNAAVISEFASSINFADVPGCRGEASGVIAMWQVLIYPGEDGYWVAEVRSLPGCISQGATREEAVANVRETITGYVAALEEDGLPVPAERFDALLVSV